MLVEVGEMILRLRTRLFAIQPNLRGKGGAYLWFLFSSLPTLLASPCKIWGPLAFEGPFILSTVLSVDMLLSTASQRLTVLPNVLDILENLCDFLHDAIAILSPFSPPDEILVI